MSDQKATRFKMTFPEQLLGMPIIHRLSADMDVVPNILRGRITEKDAWLEVEIVGTGESIEKAVAFLKKEGVSIQKIEG